MKVNFSVVFGLIAVVAIVLLSFSMNKSNRLKDEINILEKDIEEKSEEDSSNETTKENTFDEDIQWFIEKIYGLNDRVELYEEIEPSITEDIKEQLFGEDHPPKKSDSDDQENLKRNVESPSVYGKKVDEKNYEALITFNLLHEYKDQLERSFTIVKVNLHKNNDDMWLINEMIEYPTK